MKIDTKVLLGVGFVIISASCIATGFLVYRLGMSPLQLSMFLIFLGVGTLLFGMYVLHSIYRPIHTLTDIINSISHGNTDVEIPERLQERPDDIGELARAFDRTLVGLKLALKRTSPELEEDIDEMQRDILSEQNPT